jgi:hypothetical protein
VELEDGSYKGAPPGIDTREKKNKKRKGMH